jgi:cytochrome oxidase Cu insertion factor (SCO1/SenC/PrrC family)
MGFAVRVHRQWWLSLIAGIVVMLGIMATRVSSNTLHPPPGLTEVSPTIPMPDFQLADVNGSAVGSAQLRGKVVVVRVWATW